MYVIIVLIFCLLELSPVEFKDIHMVLPLDLLNMNSHADACIEILQQFGRVSSLAESILMECWNFNVICCVVRLHALSWLS